MPYPVPEQKEIDLKNQAFSYSSLARCLRPQDFYKEKKLGEDEYRKQIVNEALIIAENLFPEGISLNTIKKGGKTTYYVTNLPEKLILRRCVTNIRDCIKNPLTHRNKIVKEIRPYLREGTPYILFRLDIKSFFESIDLVDVRNELSKYPRLSVHTKNLIDTYLTYFSGTGHGIPRGVEISPIISEIILRSFDDIVRNNHDVFYYSRYVDDILILTSSCVDPKAFYKNLNKQLLGNLQFNHNKKFIKKVKARTRSANSAAGRVVLSFDFLGYEFKVTDTYLSKKTQKVSYRDVNIDITDTKLKKIKERISRAIYNDFNHPNFSLLRDRINFLATNRNLKHKNKKRSIPIGIYYNNSVIDKGSPKLNELDIFLRTAISASINRFGKKTKYSLTEKERKEILKISFARGFQNRIYKRYSPNRLEEISKIWQ